MSVNPPIFTFSLSVVAFLTEAYYDDLTLFSHSDDFLLAASHKNLYRTSLCPSGNERLYRRLIFCVHPWFSFSWSKHQSIYFHSHTQAQSNPLPRVVSAPLYNLPNGWIIGLKLEEDYAPKRTQLGPRCWKPGIPKPGISRNQSKWAKIKVTQSYVVKYYWLSMQAIYFHL